MRTLFCVVGATVLVAACPALAGPLTPPAGPVQPTNKTLDEVEPSTPIESLSAAAPYVITEPGVYHLTGNLTLTQPITSIIEIDAPGVTIDLRGHTINGARNATDAVRCAVNGQRATIRNGTITGVSDRAVFAPGISHVSVDSLKIVGVGSAGSAAVQLADHAVVRDTQIISSGAIVVGDHAIVERVQFDNMRESLQTGVGSLVRDITVQGSGATGTAIILSVGDGTLVERVTMRNAFVRAIVAGDSVTLRDIALANNPAANTGTAAVITTGPSCIVERVTITEWGGTGISAGVSNLVRDCVVRGAGVNGISLASAGLVLNCVVEEVGGTGIIGSFGSRIEGNAVRESGDGIGIQVTQDATIINNTLDGDQIRVTGNDSVIDSNQITDNSTPIDVSGEGNLIIRNRWGTGAPNVDADNLLAPTALTPATAGPWDNFAF